jgi:hypothetical protein
MLAIVAAVGAVILTVSVGLGVAAPERSMPVSSNPSIVKNVSDASTLQQNSVITQFVYWPVLVDGQLVTNTQEILDVVGQDFLLQNITSDFGFRSMVSSPYHPAIDIRTSKDGMNATTGITVVAVLTGTVIDVQEHSSIGNVLIEHNDGNQVFYTKYLHILETQVKEDDSVLPGSPIALSGPREDFNPHLDFRVFRARWPTRFDQYLNPMQFYQHLKSDIPNWSSITVRRLGEIEYYDIDLITVTDDPFWVAATVSTNDKDIVQVAVTIDDLILYTFDYFDGIKFFNGTMPYVPMSVADEFDHFSGWPLPQYKEYSPSSVAYVSCPANIPGGGTPNEDSFYYRIELGPAPESMLMQTLDESGEHFLIFEAVDSAGNVGSTSIPIQLDPSLQ